MKKSLIALLLVVALVVTVSVFAVSAAETNPFEGKTTEIVNARCEGCNADVQWSPLGTNLSAALSAGHWYLTANTNTTVYSYFSSDKICMELNGFSYNRVTSGHPFSIAGTATLNIQDSSTGKTGKITTIGGPTYCVTQSGGTVNQYGGTLTRSSSSDAGTGNTTEATKGSQGGAINMTGGTFNMYGGKISGESANRGGAICAIGSKAKVVIDGGVIENCYAFNRAGGIYVGGVKNDAATLEFKSGRISNCFIKDGSNSEFGGNIYVEFGKAIISGGTIENGGIPMSGVTIQSDADHQGGNISIRGDGAVVTVKDNARIQNGSANLGGNIYIGAGDLKVEGGQITGGKATTGGRFQSNHIGGNIYWISTGALNINADEGKTVQITGGKATTSGGNISAAAGTVNITGPDVTISGGSGTGTNIRVGAAAVNLTDVSISGAGNHSDSVSIGTNAKVKLSGSTSLDKIQVSSISDGGLAPGAQILIAEGYTGTTYVGWSDAATTENVKAGRTTHSSLWQETGYEGTGEIYALDGTSSGKILIDEGDADVEGNDNKFVVAGFSGGTVDEDGNLVLTPIADLTTASEYAFVRPYFDDPITLTGELTLDLNNSTIHVNTNGHKLNLIEMRTDKFADAGDAKDGYVKGYITVDEPANVNTVVRVEATGKQYIVVPTGTTEDGQTKFTAHRVQVDIDSVSIKPTSANLFYTTNMDTTPTASKSAVSYGVVLSLVDMPGVNFLVDDRNQDGIVDNLYTEIPFDPDSDERVNVEKTNSALLTGILNQGADEGQNALWGSAPIYANAFVCFNIDGEDIYVMADQTYQLSLLDILTIVNDTDPSNESVLMMYKTWNDPMEWWATVNQENENRPRLADIKAAYDEANA